LPRPTPLTVNFTSFYSHEALHRRPWSHAPSPAGISSLFVSPSLKISKYTLTNADIFQYLTVNGVKGAQYQYIRKNTNYNSPVTDLTSTDLRCNQGGLVGAGATATVAAGSSVTFTADTAVYHQGPISFYLAKAPSTADSFDGSGAVWFKIKDIGPTFSSSGTASWDLSLSYSVTIPASLPSGEYLLRIQSLGIHNPWPAGIPQFYISCAQISVTGGGSGVPGPKVTIPGAFKDTDPGYTANIYTNFNSYVVPGPAVWTGGDAGGGTVVVPPTTSTAAPQQPTSTAVQPPASTTPPSTGPAAPLYGQCGGQGWTGATTCASGTCKVTNQWYSQCLP
jgi:hypothetical protein